MMLLTSISETKICSEFLIWFSVFSLNTYRPLLGNTYLAEKRATSGDWLQFLFLKFKQHKKLQHYLKHS